MLPRSLLMWSLFLRLGLLRSLLLRALSLGTMVVIDTDPGSFLPPAFVCLLAEYCCWAPYTEGGPLLARRRYRCWLLLHSLPRRSMLLRFLLRWSLLLRLLLLRSLLLWPLLCSLMRLLSHPLLRSLSHPLLRSLWHWLVRFFLLLALLRLMLLNLQ